MKLLLTIHRVPAVARWRSCRASHGTWRRIQNGQIKVSVNLAGKFGTLFKTATVFYSNTAFYSNLPPTILRVTVHVPESPAMLRDENQRAAQADRQLVFKGDCAKCHADPAKDKAGQGSHGQGTICGGLRRLP